MNRSVRILGMRAEHLRKWIRDPMQEDVPYETHCVVYVVKVRSNPRINLVQHGDRRIKNRIQSGDRSRQDRIQLEDKGKGGKCIHIL